MSYTPRHEIPRSYVPTPPTAGSPLGARGGAGGGLGPSSGLVTGSGTGLGMYPRVAHPISSAAGPSGSAAPPVSLLPSGEIPIRVRIRPDLLIAPMASTAVGPIPQVPPPRNSTRFDFDVERDFVAQVEKEAAAAAAAAARASVAAEAQRPRDPFVGDDAALGEGPNGGSGDGRAGGARASGAASSSSRSTGDAVLSELQQQLEAERPGFGANAMGGEGGATQNGIEDTTQQPQPQAAPLDPAAAEYIAMGYPSNAVHLALAIHSGTSQSKVIDFCGAFGQLSEMGFAPEAIAGALALYDNALDRALAHLAPGL